MLQLIALVLGLVPPASGYSAIYELDHWPYGERVVHVSAAGETYTLDQASWSKWCERKDPIQNDRHVEYHGYTFMHAKDRIVNADTGDFIQLKPLMSITQYDGAHAWVYQSIGAMVYGRYLLWFYGPRDVDAMGDPIDRVDLFAMKERNGVPKVVKSTTVPGPGGIGNISCQLFGDRLLLRSYEGRLFLLSLKTWKTEDLRTENAVISNSGHVFWQDKGMLKQWDPSHNSWRVLRKVPQDSLVWAVKDGDDDLLQFGHSYLLAKSGKRLQLPDELMTGSVQTFFNRDVGVAIVWRTRESSRATGVVLSLKCLRVLCKVEQGRL